MSQLGECTGSLEQCEYNRQQHARVVYTCERGKLLPIVHVPFLLRFFPTFSVPVTASFQVSVYD